MSVCTCRITYLPAHEHRVSLLQLGVGKIIRIERFYEGSKGGELAPVFPVYILVGVPLTSEERVSCTNDLALKECCECGVLLCWCGKYMPLKSHSK